MEKIKLSLGQFLTLLGPAQRIMILDEQDHKELYNGVVVKALKVEELLPRMIKHIHTPIGKEEVLSQLKIWLY